LRKIFHNILAMKKHTFALQNEYMFSSQQLSLLE